ncbi:ABC transporter permease [Speluncibacter jeojiensis]|uniref:ABC transporter permease n=1 Tax=Speluncibacter jeojiensis TaxID=2710754 RepID=A0A9X4M2T8_9ACTN|nr:ABC transporter permease [Corynebacteriales bacterium D3-21]
MTTTHESGDPAETSAKPPEDTPAATPAPTRSARASRGAGVQLVLQPIVALLLAAGVLLWAFVFHTLSATERETLNASSLFERIGQHIALTVVIVAVVVCVAVPLGVLVTRPGLTWLAPVVIGIGNIGQSAPAIGLLVLFYLWVGTSVAGFWVGVLPIAFYSLLPVLRNTVLGFQSVDPSLTDAGRGQGMSAVTVLRRVELPLAVPFILAGLRTSLVLAVGTATLSFLVGAGGLGVLIDTGYKLRENSTLYVGALLAVALALFVDWLGALAERYLGPRGLR